MSMAQTKDDETVDQVKRILDGDQKRDNTIFPAALPGEGEHQMKGLFAEVNPIHVAEAEGFAARERRTAEHQNGEALVSSVSPRESVVRSGTNEYTQHERVFDRTVAGDRVVDAYAEKVGVTTDPLRDPDANPLLRDAQKVNPKTGVQWTEVDAKTKSKDVEGGAPGEAIAVVIQADGTPISVSALGDLDPEKEIKKRDKYVLDDDIDDDDLHKNIDARDPADKETYENIDVPPEGFGEPVVTEDGVPQSDPETGIPIVDEDAAKEEHKDAVATEKAAEKERKAQEKQRAQTAKERAEESKAAAPKRR
jgi:hypothetical protein